MNERQVNQTLVVVDSPAVIDAAQRFSSRHPEVSIAQSVMGALSELPTIDLADPDAIGQGVRLVILWHCLQIVPATAINTRRFINVHPGFNPHNRGWYPHVFGIAEGTPVGVTIHELDEKIDSGPIIVQREVDVGPTDTSGSVYQRILSLEERLLEEAYPSLVSGDYVAAPARTSGSVHSKVDFLELCELNPDEVVTVGAFINRLRALTHPPFWNARYSVGSERVHLRIELMADSGEGSMS